MGGNNSIAFEQGKTEAALFGRGVPPSKHQTGDKGIPLKKTASPKVGHVA